MITAETKPLKISVIMPSFNQGQFIKAALDSILTQKYPSLECIVIDAGSSDDTHAILETYRNQVTVVSAPATAQSEVMNKGLEYAQGDLITLLNADDMSSSQSYSVVSRFFSERDDIDMVYGDFDIIDQTGKKLLTHKEIVFHYPSYLFLGRFISYPTVFLRRRACLKAGRFDPSLHFAMDQDYWLRVVQHGKIEHIPAVLASFRWHPNSKSAIYEKEANEEHSRVRMRYLKNQVSDSFLQFLSRHFFYLLYKTRRVFLKLVQGKYRGSAPQPIIFYLWKRSIRIKIRKEQKELSEILIS